MHDSGGDDDNDGGVVQDGCHTPNNRLTERHMEPWFTVYFFGIGQPCYDQLTPVKTRYLLTRGLIGVKCLLKLTADQVLVFRLDRALMSG